MDYLKSLMDKNGKTRGGYVVFVHYKLFGSDFLISFFSQVRDFSSSAGTGIKMIVFFEIC